jgi:hypothetical protein
MLEEWHDFYLLIGGAAGALIGLLFVVVTLTRRTGDKADQGRRLYLSPVVVSFGVVLGTGGLAMTPHEPAVVAALILGAAALVALAYMVRVCRGLFRAGEDMVPHWSDPWWYGVWPAVAYAVMLLAAAIMLAWPGPGLDLLAASQGALVALGVRNAWDLITWIAPRANTGEGA